MTKNKLPEHCKIHHFQTRVTFNEARKFAMESPNEVAFYFNVKAKERGDYQVLQAFIGKCDKVGLIYEEHSRFNDGLFHTQPEETVRCLPSYTDILTGIGFHNIIGCPLLRKKYIHYY